MLYMRRLDVCLFVVMLSLMPSVSIMFFSQENSALVAFVRLTDL